MVIFDRRNVGNVGKFGLNAEGFKVFQSAFDFQALGLGKRLGVVKVAGAFHFDDEIVFGFRLAGKIFAFQDQAEIRLIKFPDGNRNPIPLRQLEKTNDFVVVLGGLRERTLRRAFVSHSVINAAPGRRLDGEIRFDDRQQRGERQALAGRVIAQGTHHLIHFNDANNGAGQREKLGRIFGDCTEIIQPGDNLGGGGIRQGRVLADFLNEIERGEAGLEFFRFASDFIAGNTGKGDAFDARQDDFSLVVADNQFVQGFNRAFDNFSLAKDDGVIRLSREFSQKARNDLLSESLVRLILFFASRPLCFLRRTPPASAVP